MFQNGLRLLENLCSFVAHNIYANTVRSCERGCGSLQLTVGSLDADSGAGHRRLCNVLAC